MNGRVAPATRRLFQYQPPATPPLRPKVLAAALRPRGAPSGSQDRGRSLGPGIVESSWCFSRTCAAPALGAGRCGPRRRFRLFLPDAGETGAPVSLPARQLGGQRPSVPLAHDGARAPRPRLPGPCPVASGTRGGSAPGPACCTRLPFESCCLPLAFDVVDPGAPGLVRVGQVSWLPTPPSQSEQPEQLHNRRVRASRGSGLQQASRSSTSCLRCLSCWLHSGRLVPPGSKLATSEGGLYWVSDRTNVPRCHPARLHAPCQRLGSFLTLERVRWPPTDVSHGQGTCLAKGMGLEVTVFQSPAEP